MEKDRLVRGRARQRRKTPKARTGCATCKIRRIKCDEGKPDCQKCTSTGRKCDGYEAFIQDPGPDELLVHARGEDLNALLASSNSNCAPPIRSTTIVNSSVANVESAVGPQAFAKSLYEPSNLLVSLVTPLTLFGLPSTYFASRSLDYFMHRSSSELTGPLYTQVWREYILCVSAASPAIQNAVIALSGFHERHIFPDLNEGDVECWKHYYSAVKDVNQIVEAASHAESGGICAFKEEILIACAIFLTIEILLGSTETVLRHLEGGYSLIESYLLHRQTVDPKIADLIGFFGRLDLQILTFHPRRHYSVIKSAQSSNKYTLPQISQPLPNAPSASLYRLMKHCLYWLRHYALAYRYCSTIPVSQYQTQEDFLLALKNWKSSFCQMNEITSSTGVQPSPETASLLIAYHLTYLKLHTALSPQETIFNSSECLAAFREILRLAAIILKQRISSLEWDVAHVAQRSHTFPQYRYFSLETSIVEPLYYTAIKCRHRVLRRRALTYLKYAGREGVWDGAVMNSIASHVIKVEERTTLSSLDACDLVELLRAKEFDTVDSDNGFEELGTPLEEAPNMVNEVSFNLDKDKNVVEVDCGWFVGRERSWIHERVEIALE